MNRQDIVDFVRTCALGVVATQGPNGHPQAALVMIAVTERAEIIFDTGRDSRKYANLQRSPQIAIVVGWDDEVTLQLEGTARIVTGAEVGHYAPIYLAQHPEAAEREPLSSIVMVVVTPHWARLSDLRPETFSITETTLPTP